MKFYDGNAVDYGDEATVVDAIINGKRAVVIVKSDNTVTVIDDIKDNENGDVIWEILAITGCDDLIG